MKKIFITVVTLGTFAGAQIAFADSVYISNSVNNSVSTGGNSGGNVTEGESHSSVSVHTEVNGQVVEDSHEEKTGTGDQSISIVNSYATTSGGTQVEIHTGANASTSVSIGAGENPLHHVSTSSVLQEVKDRIKEIKNNLKSSGEAATSSATTTVNASTSSKGETKSIGSIAIVIKNIFHYVFSLFTF